MVAGIIGGGDGIGVASLVQGCLGSLEAAAGGHDVFVVAQARVRRALLGSRYRAVGDRVGGFGIGLQGRGLVVGIVEALGRGFVARGGAGVVLGGIGAVGGSEGFAGGRVGFGSVDGGIDRIGPGLGFRGGEPGFVGTAFGAPGDGFGIQPVGVAQSPGAGGVVSGRPGRLVFPVEVFGFIEGERRVGRVAIVEDRGALAVRPALFAGTAIGVGGGAVGVHRGFVVVGIEQRVALGEDILGGDEAVLRVHVRAGGLRLQAGVERGIALLVRQDGHAVAVDAGPAVQRGFEFALYGICGDAVVRRGGDHGFVATADSLVFLLGGGVAVGEDGVQPVFEHVVPGGADLAEEVAQFGVGYGGLLHGSDRGGNRSRGNGGGSGYGGRLHGAVGRLGGIDWFGRFRSGRARGQENQCCHEQQWQEFFNFIHRLPPESIVLCYNVNPTLNIGERLCGIAGKLCPPRPIMVDYIA